MTTDVRIVEQHSRAMMEHLIPRSVAVIKHTIADDPDDIGSGTPIEIADRYFVSTAAHILDDVEISQLGVIALGSQPGKFDRRTPHLVGWGRRGGGKYDAVDIAWLEIHPRAAPFLISEWGRTFVKLDRVSLAPVPPEAPMYVFGAPAQFTRVSQRKGQPRLGVLALPFLTRAIPLQGSGTVGHDLYVEYLREMLTADGPKPMPAAPGLSGSGLWRVNPNAHGIWSPDSAQLVGVQHSWREHEYLRGTLMRHWLTMVREDIPELSSAIDRVLKYGTSS